MGNLPAHKVAASKQRLRPLSSLLYLPRPRQTSPIAMAFSKFDNAEALDTARVHKLKRRRACWSSGKL